MKIAIASSGVGHVARGMESWAISLARALHDRNIKVTLFRGKGSIKNKYDVVLPTLGRGTPVARLLGNLGKIGGWRVGIGNDHDIEVFTYGLQLIYHMRKRKIDLLHIQQAKLANLLLHARKVGLLFTPFVLGNGQKVPARWLDKIPYAHCLTPYGKKELTDEIGERPEWRVIPNFVDTSLFSPGDSVTARKRLGFPEKGFIVLTVGIIEKTVKRMDYVIREIEHLNKALNVPATLLMAGAPREDTNEIEAMGKALLGDRFILIRNVPLNDMPDLYRLSDVFVLGSFREALGIVIIEALSCGVPVVCHHFPVMKWVVKDGGECIDLSKDTTLAVVLKNYLLNEDFRKRKGELARKRIIETFSESVVVPKIINMYQEILELERAKKNSTKI